MKYDDLLKQATDLYKEGGWDTSFTYLDKYINENPKNSEGYLVRSEIYSVKGDLKQALDDAEKAVTFGSKDSAVYNNRGCMYIKLGDDLNKALSDFNKAIELNTKNTSAYSNRANVYLKMKEPQKAISDCTKAIDISPDKNVEPYYNRGLAYANIGETAKALDDYNKVIEIDPENVEAYAKRGLLNSELGNIQEAIHDFEKFLVLDPNNKNAKLVKKEFEKLKSADDSFEVSEAKKEIKRINIFSIVFGIIGLVVGIISVIESGESAGFFLGIWFGVGIGGGFVLLFESFGLFPRIFKRDGFTEACKIALGYGTLVSVLLAFTGPLGWLVRVLKRKKIINGGK